MHCYCQQSLEEYGPGGLEIFFDNQEKHCLEWQQVQDIQQYSTWMLALFIAFVNLIL